MTRPPAAAVRFDGVSVNYGKVRAVEGVSLEIEPGERFFLLGPSGCGKSTLLRAVAGFVAPSSGRVLIGGQDVSGVAPERRRASMVFQSYALFPHLSVEENVAYGLRAQRFPGPEISRRVAAVLAMVGMMGYEARKPGELSGGQQQRVALARAVVTAPQVLLLDEPLSNLDAALREEIREQIRTVAEKTEVTVIYVTHAQDEALALADRVALLRAGRLEAAGDPRTLYRQPPNLFAATFLGTMNWLPARIAPTPDEKGLVKARVGNQEVAARLLNRSRVNAAPSADPHAHPAQAREALLCRPEAVREGPGGEDALTLEARILRVIFQGHAEQVLLALPASPEPWRMICPRGAPAAPGSVTHIHVPTEDLWAHSP